MYQLRRWSLKTQKIRKISEGRGELLEKSNFRTGHFITKRETVLRLVVLASPRLLVMVLQICYRIYRFKSLQLLENVKDHPTAMAFVCPFSHGVFCQATAVPPLLSFHRLLGSSERCSSFEGPTKEAKCGKWPKEMPKVTPGTDGGQILLWAKYCCGGLKKEWKLGMSQLFMEAGDESAGRPNLF